nr:MAG TPA: hypothetical protein [Caudoviricetes sp.]DAQ10588.1 MAG TPA: hypothetical protein [Caudoviricetes sp.]
MQRLGIKFPSLFCRTIIVIFSKTQLHFGYQSFTI